MKITKKHVLAGILSFSLLAILVMPMMAGAIDMGTDQMGELQQSAGLGEKSLPELIGLIINVILSFLGIVAVIIVIMGGFVWMTAGGAEEKTKKAKTMIINGIIGIVIIVSAYAIASFIITKLGEIAG